MFATPDNTVRGWVCALVWVSLTAIAAPSWAQTTETPRASAVQPAAIEQVPPTPASPAAPATPAAPARPAAAPAAPEPRKPQAPVDPGQARRMRDLAQKLSTSAPAEPAPAKTPAAPASPRLAAAPPPTAATEDAALLPKTPVSSNEKLPLGRSEARTPATEGDLDKPAVNPMFGSGWVLNTVTALGLVIGLLLLVRLVLPKVAGQSGARSAGVIEVLSRVVVGPRSHVLLVRIGTRVLVLGDGPGGLRTLADIEDPDQVAHVLATVSMNKPTSVSAGFAQMVSAFNKDYREGGEPDEGADDAEVKVDRARDGVGTLLARVRHMSRGGGT